MNGAIDRMRQLTGLGVKLAIDDFGTGYSSLSALNSFPVSRLKIDRSFVADIPEDAGNMAITAAIVSLAQKLGLNVIAEGVETATQAAFLLQCGCEDMQGYYFSRPIDAEQCEALLRSAPLLGRQ
jgi:EAL domain-containing protein (putative c-di-GMP-specific phosphodiesterase class I)